MSSLTDLLVTAFYFCYPKKMKSRKQYSVYLFVAILCLLGLILFTNTFNPHTAWGIFNITISPIIPFFGLFFLIVSGSFAFLLKSRRRGILIALFVTGFLLLQYLRFNNIFYTAVLFVIIVLIEILFWKKK